MKPVIYNPSVLNCLHKPKIFRIYTWKKHNDDINNTKTLTGYFNFIKHIYLYFKKNYLKLKHILYCQLYVSKHHALNQKNHS